VSYVNAISVERRRNVGHQRKAAIISKTRSAWPAAPTIAAKHPAYSFQVPSVAHYLIMHPIRRIATHHRRVKHAIETRVIFAGPIEMAPPGIMLTLEEIYPSSPRPRCCVGTGLYQPA
jgi:hypothetical protein